MQGAIKKDHGVEGICPITVAVQVGAGAVGDDDRYIAGHGGHLLHGPFVEGGAVQIFPFLAHAKQGGAAGVAHAQHTVLWFVECGLHGGDDGAGVAVAQHDGANLGAAVHMAIELRTTHGVAFVAKGVVVSLAAAAMRSTVGARRPGTPCSSRMPSAGSMAAAPGQWSGLAVAMESAIMANPSASTARSRPLNLWSTLPPPASKATSPPVSISQARVGNKKKAASGFSAVSQTERPNDSSKASDNHRTT